MAYTHRPATPSAWLCRPLPQCLGFAHRSSGPLPASSPLSACLPAWRVLTQLSTGCHVAQGPRPLHAQTFTSEPAAASCRFRAGASAPSGPAENFSLTTAFAPTLKSSQAIHSVPASMLGLCGPRAGPLPGEVFQHDAEEGAPSWGTILSSIQRKNTHGLRGATGQTTTTLTWGLLSSSSPHASFVWLRNFMDGVVRYNAGPRQPAI